MLRFFRHIRKTLIEHLPAGQAGNKVRTYILYAIGEILLVMIGILLALQVNNWNEDRKAKTLEYSLLTELQKSMNEDIINLKSTIEHNQSYMNSGKIVLNAIENNEIVNDTVSYHLKRTFGVWRIYFKTSAYSNLEEYGLHIIKNEETRRAIISGYDGRAKFVDELYERYSLFAYNVVEPELSKTFQFNIIEDNEYGLFPIQNNDSFNPQTLRYLIIKSMSLQDQIIRAMQRTLRGFEKLYEELNTEMVQFSH